MAALIFDDQTVASNGGLSRADTIRGAGSRATGPGWATRNSTWKSAGADGALLCTIPLAAPAYSLALDELGYPITREQPNLGGAIAKYVP
jgi:hypothetical protein